MRNIALRSLQDRSLTLYQSEVLPITIRKRINMEEKKKNNCLKRYIIVVFKHFYVYFPAAGVDTNHPV